MHEPIGIRTFPDDRGERFNARQIIFACSNGLGLSVINCQRGTRTEHGWYTHAPDQYEAYLVSTVLCTAEDPFQHRPINATPSFNIDINAYGWFHIEEVGDLLDTIERDGIPGYINWRTPAAPTE